MPWVAPTKTETRPGALLPRVSLALRTALMATIMLSAQVENDNHAGQQSISCIEDYGVTQMASTLVQMACQVSCHLHVTRKLLLLTSHPTNFNGIHVNGAYCCSQTRLILRLSSFYPKRSQTALMRMRGMTRLTLRYSYLSYGPCLESKWVRLSLAFFHSSACQLGRNME